MEKSILGIDVSKKELVVVLLVKDKKKSSEFSNDSQGYQQLHKWIEARIGSSELLACAEATGHYSAGIARYLYASGYAVSVVNPYCIKAYANSKLARHKNDKVDAGIIAEYARVHTIELYKAIDPAMEQIRYLYRCMDDLKNMRIQVQNHLEGKEYLPEFVNAAWVHMLEEIDKKIINIEEEISHRIKIVNGLEKKYKLLQTIPGISKTTALAILAELPAIESFKNARQLAAYIGITPKHRQSGTSLKGRSRISKIGSSKLRKALYFPAIVAKNHNPVIKLFCDNLKRKGKHTMAIICAAMRKLIHIIYGVLKNQESFKYEVPKVA